MIPITCFKGLNTITKSGLLLLSFWTFVSLSVGAESSVEDRLAFVREGDIWVVGEGAGEPTRLTDDGLNTRPRWSPEGRWLMYLKGIEGEKDYGPKTRYLWVMKADGSAARQVERAPLGSFPAWSPTESCIAYATEDGALRWVEADGSGRRQLLPPGSGVWQVAWSPEGRRLAFSKWIQDSPQDSTAYVMNADGTGLIQLFSVDDPLVASAVEGLGYGWSRVASWSPDGERLALFIALKSASLTADGLNLFTVNVNGQNLSQVGWMLGYEDFLTWSPDGGRLAFVDGFGRDTWREKQIAVLEVEAMTVTNLSADQTRADIWPDWSPDGRHIVYVSAPAQPQELMGIMEMTKGRHIWVMAAEGTEVRQLTDDPVYADERPRWVHGGEDILFFRRREEGSVEIWLMSADGSEQRPLAKDVTFPEGYYGHSRLDEVYDWYEPEEAALMCAARHLHERSLERAQAVYPPRRLFAMSHGRPK